MIALVRQLAKDPETDPNGQTIETLRFSVGEVIDAINFQLKDMYLAAGMEHIGESLLAADLSYTPDAADGMDIPSVSVPLDAPIVLVEDITDARYRYRIRYVGPQEVENYQSDVRIDDRSLPPSVYSLSAAAAGRGQRLRVRPSPGSRSLRIWYLSGPFTLDNAAPGVDVVPYSVEWSEYVACGAAWRLLGDDSGPTLESRLARCAKQFEQRAARLADNDTIRMEYPHL
jgi:hypothetical protein